MDYTVLSFQKALPCPFHIGESFMCTLIPAEQKPSPAKRAGCFQGKQTVQGSDPQRKRGVKRLEGAGSTQATWHKPPVEKQDVPVSKHSKAVGFASAYAAVCRVPRTHSLETKQQPHKFHHTGQLPKESRSVLPWQLVPSQGIHPFWAIIHSILSYCDQKSQLLES